MTASFHNPVLAAVELLAATTTKLQRKNHGGSQKRVRFCKNVTARYTIARDDLSPEELAAAWFSPVESAAITKACCRVIAKLEMKNKKGGGDDHQESFCARGLESHTRIGDSIKHKHRFESIHAAVLKEQEEQYQRGITDDESISRVYQNVASSAQLWAATIGLRDHQDADQIFDHDDELLVVLEHSYDTRSAEPRSVLPPLCKRRPGAEKLPARQSTGSSSPKKTSARRSSVGAAAA